MSSTFVMQILYIEMDYDPGPYYPVFLANTTTTSFIINIFDNATFEASESFHLNIDPSGFVFEDGSSQSINLTSFVFQGDPSQAIATILDHRGLFII